MPIEPEYFKRANDEDFDVETSRVDELFKVSSIVKSVFVPRAGKDVIDVAERKHQTETSQRTTEQRNLLNKYWHVEWFETEDDQGNICQGRFPWRTFNCEMREQVKKDFESITEWMAHVLIKSKLPRRRVV